MRLIVGGGLAVVCAGLGVGVLVALAATRFLESSLYDVSATDPLTFVAVAGVLLLVALVAQARADRARDARRSVDRAATGVEAQRSWYLGSNEFGNRGRARSGRPCFILTVP